MPHRGTSFPPTFERDHRRPPPTFEGIVVVGLLDEQRRRAEGVEHLTDIRPKLAVEMRGCPEFVVKVDLGLANLFIQRPVQFLVKSHRARHASWRRFLLFRINNLLHLFVLYRGIILSEWR